MGLSTSPRWAEYRVVRSLTEYLPLILSVVWLTLGTLAGFAVDRYILRRLTQSHKVKESFWLAVSVDAVRGVAIVWA